MSGNPLQVKKINSSLWTYVKISDSEIPEFNLRVYGETTRILKKDIFPGMTFINNDIFSRSMCPCLQSSVIHVPYYV